jgi:hypothetical protein
MLNLARVTDALAAVARTVLEPLGVHQKGRSRTWIGNRGWWLVLEEFQPSRTGSDAYLNVGEQHLWIERDHLVFEELYCCPVVLAAPYTRRSALPERPIEPCAL